MYFVMTFGLFKYYSRLTKQIHLFLLGNDSALHNCLSSFSAMEGMWKGRRGRSVRNRGCIDFEKRVTAYGSWEIIKRSKEIKFHLTPTRMAIIKKVGTNSDEDVEKLESSYIVCRWGCKMVQQFRRHLAILQKLSYRVNVSW